MAESKHFFISYNNADDIEMVRPYLPVGNKTNGHIILTTCAQAVGTMVARTMQVNKMDNRSGNVGTRG